MWQFTRGNRIFFHGNFKLLHVFLLLKLLWFASLNTLPCTHFGVQRRRIIIETPDLVDRIRSILVETESVNTKEVAKGALWTLGESCLGWRGGIRR